MSRIFSLDSPLWMLLNKITDVIILSLLFIVTSIPIVTAGASLTALYYNMFRLADNTEGNIVRGYFQKFRENFKTATFVWLICLVIGGMLAGDLYICIKMNIPAASFLMAFFTMAGVIFMAIVTYLFPLLSYCNGSVRKIVFMAFMMSVKEIFRTVFLMFITIIMIAVGVFVTAPFLVVTPGIVALSHVYVFKEIFRKYDMKAGEAEC
ncbi:MAG: YesL family protein [Thermoflexaceae bacterium]|nr:YesL family protein [Thermoflexaceae bacterium]